jgi:hypothetical protein
VWFICCLPPVNPVRNSSGALNPAGIILKSAAEQRGIISNGVKRVFLRKSHAPATPVLAENALSPETGVASPPAQPEWAIPPVTCNGSRMLSSSRLEKEIILSPISQILFRGLFYSRLHPRNLILKVSLVTL